MLYLQKTAVMNIVKIGCGILALALLIPIIGGSALFLWKLTFWLVIIGVVLIGVALLGLNYKKR